MLDTPLSAVLWTVSELATACPGQYTNTGHMKLNGSMTRKYSIHIIIHLCIKSCHRQGLTRAFALCGYVATKSCHSPAGTDSRTCAMIREVRWEFVPDVPRSRITLIRRTTMESTAFAPSTMRSRRYGLLFKGPANLCCQRRRFCLIRQPHPLRFLMLNRLWFVIRIPVERSTVQEKWYYLARVCDIEITNRLRKTTRRRPTRSQTNASESVFDMGQ